MTPRTSVSRGEEGLGSGKGRSFEAGPGTSKNGETGGLLFSKTESDQSRRRCGQVSSYRYRSLLNTRIRVGFVGPRMILDLVLEVGHLRPDKYRNLYLSTPRAVALDAGEKLIQEDHCFS